VVLADVVITRRCVDSAPTLGAAIHAHGWGAGDLDALAGGPLAGHPIECGPQATGGNCTDGRLAGSPDAIGHPIAEIAADGPRTLTVAPGARGGGLRAAAAERMLYEIGDPQAWALPDAICDVSGVAMRGADGAVHVCGARGRAPSGMLKLSVSYADGFRAGQLLAFNGRDARAKAQAFAAAARRRAEAGATAPFAHWSAEALGGAPLRPRGVSGDHPQARGSPRLGGRGRRLRARASCARGQALRWRRRRGCRSSPRGAAAALAGDPPSRRLAPAAAISARVTLDGRALADADPRGQPPTPPPSSRRSPRRPPGSRRRRRSRPSGGRGRGTREMQPTSASSRVIRR
jgi:hypothetical protein